MNASSADDLAGLNKNSNKREGGRRLHTYTRTRARARVEFVHHFACMKEKEEEDHSSSRVPCHSRLVEATLVNGTRAEGTKWERARRTRKCVHVAAGANHV